MASHNCVDAAPFGRNASAPAPLIASWTWGSALTEKPITRIAGCAALMCFVASMPFIPGILTSITITSRSDVGGHGNGLYAILGLSDDRQFGGAFQDGMQGLSHKCRVVHQEQPVRCRGHTGWIEPLLLLHDYRVFLTNSPLNPASMGIPRVPVIRFWGRFHGSQSASFTDQE